jgi:two-component system, OmpR family, sensor kinase
MPAGQSTSTPGLDAAVFEEVRTATLPRLICDARQDDMPIVAANGAFANLSGYSIGECLGRNCRFLQGAETERGTVDQIRNALASHAAIACEILNYRKDGTPFWNALFLHPIFDSHGCLAYYTSLQIDVTLRHSGTQNVYLAGRLAEIMGTVAHELRNPMTPIVGMVQLLRIIAARERDIPSKLIQLIDRLMLATDVFSRRANALLEFSRLVSGKFEITHSSLDVAEIVRSAVERHEILADLAGTRFDVRVPASIVVEWDRVAIEQIFDNLISNALKFCDKKPIEIEAIDLDNEVSIAFRDHGVGIAEEDAHAVFKRFERGSAPHNGGGFGIGLWVVRELCQAMGGSVRMTSSLGRGATFTVRLPKNSKERAP